MSATRFFIGLFASLGSTLTVTFVITASSDEASRCDNSDPFSGGLLNCVAQLVAGQADPASILRRPINGYLQRLADSPGYRGQLSDLSALKKLSIDLKRNPLTNRDAIAILDNAVASDIDELRPNVSQAAFAADELNLGIKPDADIYDSFIKHKLEFLQRQVKIAKTDRTKTIMVQSFYDGGPFEILVRSLLANQLEAAYFLDQTGTNSKSYLNDELIVLDDELRRLGRSPEEQYVSVTQVASKINTVIFWRASIMFVLGQRANLKNLLRGIVQKHSRFGLQTPDPGHIYVYRVFNRPYKIILKADGDVEIRDLFLVNRFYNPAQLALFACSFIQDAGSGPAIDRFVSAIGNIVFSDYYVVAATSDNRAELDLFNRAIDDAINDNDELRQNRDRVVKRVAALEIDGFAKAIENGARQCEVDDSIRDQVYSSFSDFKGRVDQGRLVFGGRFNVDQARTVAEFLNTNVFKYASVAKSPLASKQAYVARMQLNQ
jgi:hypothetical protein